MFLFVLMKLMQAKLSIMNRMGYVYLLFCCISLPILEVHPASGSKPNIVIFFADDVGYGDVGCYGGTHISTPNIDRLANQGRRFTDAHSASAVCSPSRYALITGRYPVRHGTLWSPIFLRRPLVIDPDRKTIADVAKAGGYATTCIGKWHLGFGTKTPTDWNAELKPGPLELGFDSFFGIPVVNSHPPFVFIENHRVLGWDPEDPFVYKKTAKTRIFDEKFGINEIGGADAAHALYDDEQVGTELVKRADDWISEQSKKDHPFFLYFASHAIHHPFTPAPRWKGSSKAGPYGDFMQELDWMLGEIMRSLKENGVDDNTILIFTSDNGGMLNRGGQEAIRRGHRLNGEMLGFKFDAWEGGHRVPFIAKWPGHIPSGTTSDALVSNIDLMATVAAVSGQTLKADEGPDSFNLLPALTGKEHTPVRDHLLIAPARESNLSLRKGDWMYINAQAGGGFGAKKVGEHAFGGPAAFPFTGNKNSDIQDGKIIEGAPKTQLYHLGRDPRQSTNVIRDYPEVAKQLKAEMIQIRSQSTAPHTR